MSEPGRAEGHVFLSYVREDSARADRLQHDLEAAGVRVWRDTRDLWPGQDWRQMIRRAISEQALVFIACFSRASASRGQSYQNEELALAAEQLRLRAPGLPWLIPVRFDDCAIPDPDIGGGRALSSIQRADLFGPTLTDHTVKLIKMIHQILGPNVGADDSTDHSAQASTASAAPRTLACGTGARIVNPWERTPPGPPYVLPEDSAAVRQWNESLAQGDARRIELHVLPEPALGLHDAPVLLLLANPGSTPGDRLIDRTWLTPANWDALRTPGGTANYNLDNRAAAFPGGQWWREATRGLLAPDRGYADLATKLLVVQWHGYHSARPSYPRQGLPSQDFAIALVTAAMDRHAAIILGTATPFWLSRIPGLRTYRHLVTKKSAQSKSLSPRNLGDGYPTVTAALNNEQPA